MLMEKLDTGALTLRMIREYDEDREREELRLRQMAIREELAMRIMSVPWLPPFACKILNS